jgi:hypothetical protein
MTIMAKGNIFPSLSGIADIGNGHFKLNIFLRSISLEMTWCKTLEASM